MKRLILFICLCLTAALLLGGCTGEPDSGASGTADFTDSTDPTDPTSLEPDAETLTGEEAARLESLLQSEDQWYGRLLCCCYSFSSVEDPMAELHIRSIFANNVPGKAVEFATEKEIRTLEEQFENYFRLETVLDVLVKYLGVTEEKALALIDGETSLFYLEQTDCFYAHSEFNFVKPEIYAAYRRKDGTISVYYKDTIEDYGVTVDYDSVAVLKPLDDGYQLLSNKRHINWNN
ncbi:MAG: hypothetical protein ACI3V3_02205 [Faecousia sp.]